VTWSRAVVIAGTAGVVSLVGLVGLGGPGGPGAGTALATTGTVSRPTPSASPATTAQATVQLTGFEPRVVGPGAVLTMSGNVVNTGSRELADVRIRFRYDDTPEASRGDLDADAGSQEIFGQAVQSGEQSLGTLPAAGHVPFTLTVPVDSLHLGGYGVYLVGAEVRAHTQRGPNARVGVLRTFLPWIPAGQTLDPTRVVWLWPLAAKPTVGADGLFLDDGLAKELRGDGRLTRLLQAAVGARTPSPPGTPPVPGTDPQQPVPVTWVVDPSLVDAAGRMAAGYQVHVGGQVATGTGTPVAQSWLNTAKAALAGQPVLGLPFADPDVDALTAVGLTGDIGSAVTHGAAAMRPLGVPGGGRTALPPDGFISSEALTALVTSGDRDAVLSADALPVRRDYGYTPDGRADVTVSGETVRVALSDPTLDGIMATAETGSTNGSGSMTPRLIEQRFLAETAMITAELPNHGRTVVIVPPRRWTVPARLAQAMLLDTGRVPWMQPATLSQLLASPPPSSIRRRTLTLPSSEADNELSRTFLTGGRRGIPAIRTDLNRIGSVFPDPDQAVQSVNLALLRSESAAWRDDQAAGLRMRASARAEVNALEGGISVASSGLVTLSGRSGPVPVTVSNELDQPVHVQLEVSARNSARLTGRTTMSITVPAHAKVQERIQVTTVAAGVFPVSVRLLTPLGEPFGSAVEIRVRPTGYGQLALLITGGATALLFGAVIVRLTRRGLRALRRHPVQGQVGGGSRTRTGGRA
jgi:hypothetical protein